MYHTGVDKQFLCNDSLMGRTMQRLKLTSCCISVLCWSGDMQRVEEDEVIEVRCNT